MIVPAACYFPLTELSETGLIRALSAVGEIILYRLPLDHPLEGTLRAADAGRVRFLDADVIGDEAEIGRLLNDFNQWVAQHRSPGELGRLKSLMAEAGPETSALRLMQAIRRQSRPPAPGQDPRREAQIFMTFARLLDRQQTEVEDLLARVSEKESLLSGLMGVEEAEAEEDALSLPPDPIPRSAAGPAMIPGRLAAWARLYESFGPWDVPLLTDCPEAVSELDLNLARTRTGPDPVAPGRTEVLLPVAEIAIPAAAQLELTAQNGGSGEWAEFFQRLVSRAWAEDEIPGLKDEAAGLAAGMPGLENAGHLLTAYMLPGSSLKKALPAAAGLGPAAGEPGVYCGPVIEIISPA